MNLESWIAVALVVAFAICSALLWYDIRQKKKISELDRELAIARRMNTKMYEREAIAAQEGQ